MNRSDWQAKVFWIAIALVSSIGVYAFSGGDEASEPCAAVCPHARGHAWVPQHPPVAGLPCPMSTGWSFEIHSEEDSPSQPNVHLELQGGAPVRGVVVEERFELGQKDLELDEAALAPPVDARRR